MKVRVVRIILLGIVYYVCTGALLRDEQNKRFVFGRSLLDSFECGFMGNGYTTKAGGFFYILIVVFFVVFDLEVALLLNMPYQDELFFKYWVYLVFVLLVSVGFWVEIRNGYVR